MSQVMQLSRAQEALINGASYPKGWFAKNPIFRPSPLPWLNASYVNPAWYGSNQVGGAIYKPSNKFDSALVQPVNPNNNFILAKKVLI